MRTSKSLIIPYFISHQGCRNKCVYCNQHILKDHKSFESIDDTVAKYNSYTNAKDVYDKELAFFGGTFLNLPIKQRKKFLSKALDLKKNGVVRRLRISTTPDSVSPEVCAEIKGVVDTVELGVQTTDNYLLKIMGRNYDYRTIHYATKLLKAAGVKVCHQIMIGLPFETFNSLANTVDQICELQPHYARIYPLIVCPGTDLAKHYLCKTYIPATKEEILKRLGYALYAFEKSGIKVIRVGLDAFVDKKDVLFSYHEKDWRGAAYAFLWQKILLANLKGTSLKELTIYAAKKDFHHLIGPRKANITFFSLEGIKLNIKSENTLVSGIYIKELDTTVKITDISWSRLF